MASKVCHFFAREWVSDGKKLVVVHFQPVHCLAWYMLVRLFGPFLESRLNGLYYKRPIRKVQHYFMDGVEIYRIPCWIPIPRGRFSERILSLFCEKVFRSLSEIGFKPEMIVGHLLPIELIPMLNKKYGVKTCMVAHGSMPKLKSRYPDYRGLISSYTAWGFRSESIRKQFTELNGEVKNPFLCYSGIPSAFIAESISRTSFDASNIIYVGDLIERKYPLAVVQAAYKAFGDRFSLCFVGDGAEKARIVDYAAKMKIEHCLHFVGKVPREEVKNYLDSASVFAMVSRGEAFGLVYLEAMSRACLTIASEGEGMDGIIKDKINGYLAPAGDADYLASLFKRISETPQESLIELASRGYATSLDFSDKNMARDYWNKLERIK